MRGFLLLTISAVAALLLWDGLMVAAPGGSPIGDDRATRPDNEGAAESSSPAQSTTSALGDGWDNFMQGIFDHEGAGPRDRYNNPGNIFANSDSYWQGQTGRAPNGEAIFGDQGDGWRALQRDIRTVLSNHPDWDFFDFFEHYSPRKAGNDPEAYAESVAEYMGVEPTTRVGEAIQA